MGLDMYLRASDYISRYDYTEDDRIENPLFMQIAEQSGVVSSLDPTGFTGIDISFPMGYWRKANQIHNWFVQEIQNGVDECQTAYVDREQLIKLKSLCEQVLADKSLATELLPPSSGFFFGSYEIDEYYFQDLKDTVEIIDRCLASKFGYFEYQSSW